MAFTPLAHCGRMNAISAARGALYTRLPPYMSQSPRLIDSTTVGHSTSTSSTFHFIQVASSLVRSTKTPDHCPVFASLKASGEIWATQTFRTPEALTFSSVDVDCANVVVVPTKLKNAAANTSRRIPLGIGCSPFIFTAFSTAISMPLRRLNMRLIYHTC